MRKHRLREFFFISQTDTAPPASDTTRYRDRATDPPKDTEVAGDMSMKGGVGVGEDDGNDDDFIWWSEVGLVLVWKFENDSRVVIVSARVRATLL